MSPDLEEARRRIWARIKLLDKAGRVSEANALERAVVIIDQVEKDGGGDGD